MYLDFDSCLSNGSGYRLWILFGMDLDSENFMDTNMDMILYGFRFGLWTWI